eukprot:6554302-Prymnesium_polylepis.1
MCARACVGTHARATHARAHSVAGSRHLPLPDGLEQREQRRLAGGAQEGHVQLGPVAAVAGARAGAGTYRKGWGTSSKLSVPHVSVLKGARGAECSGQPLHGQHWTRYGWCDANGSAVVREYGSRRNWTSAFCNSPSNKDGIARRAADRLFHDESAAHGGVL